MSERLPRQIAAGTWWLGDCLDLPPDPNGKQQHTYNSLYYVSGESSSMIVDTGHPKDWEAIGRQLSTIDALGLPPVRWLFPTHPEVAHAGNLGRLLARYPDADVCGDVHDYQLAFPASRDRLRQMHLGEEIDLGGRSIVCVEAVFRDLISSIWAYDRREGVLFSGDGLGFCHYHGDGHCGLLTEEMPGLPIPEATGIFLEYSLYWTRLKDVEPHIARLDALMNVDYRVEIVAAAHGSPIVSPEKTMPQIREGLRQVTARRT